MKSSKIIISIVLVVAVLFGLYLIFFPTNSSGATPSSVSGASENSNTHIIYVNASRFTYTPDTITVKKGEHVKIMVNNLDFGHGLYIPDLNVGGMDSVEFTADTAGTYSFKCPTMCGSGHREMKGTLIVTE